jgi:superfamily I DNA/RNA helicase
VIGAIAKAFVSNELNCLRDGDVVAGSLRITFQDGVAVFVHGDYVTGTGDEPVGFILVSGRHAIVRYPEVAPAALERAVFVVSQRLQNRLFESKFFYQRLNDTKHAIGTPSVQGARTSLHLGWVERAVRVGATVTRTVLLCGPDKNESVASETALELSSDLPVLVQAVRDVLTGGRRAVVSDDKVPDLRRALDKLGRVPTPVIPVTTIAQRPDITPADRYRTDPWSFDTWCDPERTTLSKEQLNVLFSDALLHHPVRLIGPAGAGKTLLMQLMAIRRLREDATVLYVTHNAPMEKRVQDRFWTLGAGEYLQRGRLLVATLSRYSQELLKLPRQQVMNIDPEKAKDDQIIFLHDAVQAALELHDKVVSKSVAFRALTRTENARRVLDEFVRAEIGSVIKGRGMIRERAAYTDAESALGQLHGVLSPEERGVIYTAYELYKKTLEDFEVLDADDVALTMLGQLRTPQWDINRVRFGFDFVLVDEAQLFSDNERRIFALLTKSQVPHTPVAIALDEGQRLYSPPSSGLALLGIPDVQQMTLSVAHRLSAEIARLALFVISESDIIYTDDFPEFPHGYLTTAERRGDGIRPKLFTVDTDLMARRVGQLVREALSHDLRHIAIVVHSQDMMDVMETELRAVRGLEVAVLQQRGAGRSAAHAYVVISRPQLIGGQEFDCVICCRLEEGVVPPPVNGNHALQIILEQQAFREIYVAFTRARHQLFIVNATNSRPTPILQQAADKGYIEIVDDRD